MKSIEIPVSGDPAATGDAIFDALREAECYCEHRSPWRLVAGKGVGIQLRKMRFGSGEWIYHPSPDGGHFMGCLVRFTDDPAMAGRLVLEVE